MAVVRQLAARWTFLISTGREEDYTSSAFAARYDFEPEWNWGAIPGRLYLSFPAYLLAAKRIISVSEKT